MRLLQPSAPSTPPAAETTPAPRPGWFISRQSLLDARDRVIGHELRHLEQAPLEVLPGADTLQQVRDEALLVYLIDQDYQHALGGKLSFLRIASATLLNPLLEQLPAGRVVLMLSPEPRPDPALIARAAALTGRGGLLLGLDDLGEASVGSALLPYCQYLHLDSTQFDVIGLDQRVRLWRGAGKRHLIASRVDTPEVFEACVRLGFDLFQGEYFTRVSPSRPARLDSNVMRVMELLNQVMERAEFQVLEDGFKLDPTLSYKLLRYINSPAIGLRTPVRSLAHALSLLGYDQTYRWLTLLLFGSVETGTRNLALLRNALARAHFTEALGQDRLPPEQRGGLFICGMFSLLDALLNVPMTQALANLSLPPQVGNALVYGDGPYAPYLALARACERFDQDSLTHLASAAGLHPDAVNLAHVNALIWSERVEL